MAVLAIFAALALAIVAVLGNRQLSIVGAVLVGLLVLMQLVSSRRTAARQGPTDEDEGWAALDREMLRHRRHGRQLTLCRLVQEVPGDRSAIAHAEQTAPLLQDQLRVDDIAFASGEIIYLVLPETGPETASVPLARLSGFLAGKGAHAGVALASYPHDALTVRGLIEHAATSSVRSLTMTSGEAVGLHSIELSGDSATRAV